jgi:hypothetical protein
MINAINTLGGQITFAQRGPVALLRPAARFGARRLGGWRLCYVSAGLGSHGSRALPAAHTLIGGGR